MTTAQKIKNLKFRELPNDLKEILMDVVLKSEGITEELTLDGKVLTFVKGQLINVADE